MRKSERAITLVALSIAIVVILIISGIGISSGKEIIKKAQLEELKTNMLLIKAKAREYVEMANFKIGLSTEETEEGRNEITRVRKEVYEDEAKLETATETAQITPTGALYKVTEEAMNEWGLDKVKLLEGEEYLIDFDDKNANVEVYNTIGFKDNGATVYSLTDIEAIDNK